MFLNALEFSLLGNEWSDKDIGKTQTRVSID